MGANNLYGVQELVDQITIGAADQGVEGGNDDHIQGAVQGALKRAEVIAGIVDITT